MTGTSIRSASTRLDMVASVLQAKGYDLLASSLDVVSNTLDDSAVSHAVQVGLSPGGRSDLKEQLSHLLGHGGSHQAVDRHLVSLAESWVARHPADAKRVLDKVSPMLPPGVDTSALEVLAAPAGRPVGSREAGGSRSALVGAVLLAMLSAGAAHAGGLSGISEDGRQWSYEQSESAAEAGEMLTRGFAPGQTKVVQEFREQADAEEYLIRHCGGSFRKGLEDKGLEVRLESDGSTFRVVVAPEGSGSMPPGSAGGDAGGTAVDDQVGGSGVGGPSQALQKARAGLSRLFGGRKA